MHFYGKTTQPRRLARPGAGEVLLARPRPHRRLLGRLREADDGHLRRPHLRSPSSRPTPRSRRPRKKGEKAPGPQIATVRFEKDVAVIARQIDPETGFLKDKKRIVHQDLFYDKATGEFTGIGPGEVFLYTTGSNEDKVGPAPGPMASDRRTVKPASARQQDPKAKKTPTSQPEITLTHVIFQKKMLGRFTPPEDAKPGDYNNVYFAGSVETMMAKVKDEDTTLDPDNPPDDFYRMVSRAMTVNIEPPPVKTEGAKDRILLDAWGDPEAQTRQKHDQGRPDHLRLAQRADLRLRPGQRRGISNQDGSGQPYTSGRGETVKHNHKTGETKVINPEDVQRDHAQQRHAVGPRADRGHAAQRRGPRRPGPPLQGPRPQRPRPQGPPAPPAATVEHRAPGHERTVSG